MKVISKIFKQADSRVGQCVDGEIVPLVAPRDVSGIKVAIECGRSAGNIFKVKTGNKLYPLGHARGGYIDYQGTTISFL